MVILVLISKLCENNNTLVVDSNKKESQKSSNGVKRSKSNKMRYVSGLRLCGIGSFVLGNFVSQIHIEPHYIDDDRVSVVSCETESKRDKSLNSFKASFNDNASAHFANRVESITIGVSETPNFGNIFISQSQDSSSVDNIKMKLNEDVTMVEDGSLFAPRFDFKSDHVNS